MGKNHASNQNLVTLIGLFTLVARPMAIKSDLIEVVGVIVGFFFNKLLISCLFSCGNLILQMNT